MSEITLKGLQMLINNSTGSDGSDDSPVFLIDDNSNSTPVYGLNLSETDVNLIKLLQNKFASKVDNNQDNLAMILIYSLIALISLFGNFLVLFVILKNKRMRTKTNILMANITVSDVMMTMFNIPFNIVRSIFNDWPFGVVLCKMVPSIQVTTVYVSTFTMTIIAIDRYQAINSKFYRRISNVLPIKITIELIWVVAFLFSTPELLYNRLVEYKLVNTIRCNTVYPEPKRLYKQMITLLTFSTQYLIPLMITTVAYIKIINKICRKYRRRDHDIQKRIKNTDKKIIKMLAIVVLVFALCWLPLNLFHLYAVFSPKLVRYNTMVFYSCHMLAMSSVIYNPFIYFGLNKHFRTEFRELFSFVPFCRLSDEKTHQSSYHGDSFRRSSRSELNNNHNNVHHHFFISDNYNNYLNMLSDQDNTLIDQSFNDSIVNRNLIDTNVL